MARNTLFSAVGEGSNLLLFLLGFLMARLMGDSAFGAFAEASAFVGLFRILPDFGMSYASTLEIDRDRSRAGALVGNLLSNSRIAVAQEVASRLQLPYLNFSFYEGSITSPYFFHFAALPNQQIDRMIPYMRGRFGGRMFFAGNNYEWPRGSVSAARRVLDRSGGTSLGEEYFALGIDGKARPSNWFFPSPLSPPRLPPVWIGARAPHPHSAALFVDFLLSRRGQEAMAAQGRWVGRQDVKYLVDPGTRKVQVVSPLKWGARAQELVELFDKLILRKGS